MMETEKKEEIYQNLMKSISEVIGEDVVQGLDITPNSVFSRDLEMDSIEIVLFAEKVKKQYGDKVDFTTWLSKKSVIKLFNLSIKDVVNFIADADN